MFFIKFIFQKVRKSEKDKADNPNYMSTCFFNFMRHRDILNSPSAELVRLNNSEKMRQKEILMRHKFYCTFYLI